MPSRDEYLPRGTDVAIGIATVPLIGPDRRRTHLTFVCVGDGPTCFPVAGQRTGGSPTGMAVGQKESYSVELHGALVGMAWEAQSSVATARIYVIESFRATPLIDPRSATRSDLLDILGQSYDSDLLTLQRLRDGRASIRDILRRLESRQSAGL